MNPLQSLPTYGQSVWLDYIRRSLLTSGELQRMVEEDGLAGVTSNPSIFEKAITGSRDYADTLQTLAGEYQTPKPFYERIAVRDIQDAADILKTVYRETDGRDGFVSLEVSPDLAHDTAGTLEEARRLWDTIARQNVMIKVPATPAGIPAIEHLIGDGINVNVTLLFGQAVYEQVVGAYIKGLERRLAQGGEVHTVASVASFFVSRIDTKVDAMLGERLKSATDAVEKARLERLMGQTAIANAKLTYRRYQALFQGERWKALAAHGARTQRVLWASTSTKNPHYRVVKYVEELIGPETVNTMPPATLEAFRKEGRLRPSLTEDVETAAEMLDELGHVGISLAEVTDTLLDEGVKAFQQAFDQLLDAVEKGRLAAVTPKINLQTLAVPERLAAEVQTSLAQWQEQGNMRRLWAGDASLWTGTDEGDWLGWLAIAEEQLTRSDQFRTLAREVVQAGFTDALLLGMGGSSLCPEVLTVTFGAQPGSPRLHVLDSTDPAQIRAVESQLDLTRTLFIVSSKSGGTLEPNILKQYFFERVKHLVDPQTAGTRFIAITDPGSKLEHIAKHDRFRHVFYGVPSIGGRYSALSDFGMVPAAIMGLDVPRFLEWTEAMVQACASCVPVAENPAAVLGTLLGVSAKHGRDKVTLITSPALKGLGAWIEQLLAESTGKDGKGLIPIDLEVTGPPNVYGNDRVFVYTRLASDPDTPQEAAVKALEGAGQPVVRITVSDLSEVGQEFFRWELATAVAGAIIGINAFNQPDVEASKIIARELTTAYEKTGGLPAEAPILEERGVKLFADHSYTERLHRAMSGTPSLQDSLKTLLSELQEGEYFAVLAFLERREAHIQPLQALRHRVRDARRVATCLGFGPRFLHSTGQAYKGGPNSGVFVYVTCDDATDLPIPGQHYTFGVVKAAQARGDFQALTKRGRRALRVHLGADVPAGLAVLKEAVDAALT